MSHKDARRSGRHSATTSGKRLGASAISDALARDRNQGQSESVQREGAAVETDASSSLELDSLVAAVVRLNAGSLTDDELSEVLLTGVEGLDWDLSSDNSDNVYVSATHEVVHPLRAQTLIRIQNELTQRGHAVLEVDVSKQETSKPPHVDFEVAVEARVDDLIARLEGVSSGEES